MEMSEPTEAQRLDLDLGRIVRKAAREWRTDVEILRALGERLDRESGLRESFKLRLAVRALRAH